MSTFRHHIHSGFTRTVAVLVCLILGQTLAAALLHTVVVDHIWCETHQDFEHLDNNFDDLTEHVDLDDLHLDARPSNEHRPGEDERPTDNLCFYLTSLHGPAVPLPPMHASLLNLPPPIDAGTNTQTPGDPAFLPRQIDTLHESPGLSPPPRMV